MNFKPPVSFNVAAKTKCSKVRPDAQAYGASSTEVDGTGKGVFGGAALKTVEEAGKYFAYFSVSEDFSSR